MHVINFIFWMDHRNAIPFRPNAIPCFRIIMIYSNCLFQKEDIYY